MGKITPVSLLACMIVTSSVSGRKARMNSRTSRLPLAIDAQERHLVAVALEVLADLQHGRMLDGGGDDVPPVRIGLGRAEDRRVVALRGAGGEEDLPRIDAAEMPGDRPAGPAAIAVAACRAGSYIELGLK